MRRFALIFFSIISFLYFSSPIFAVTVSISDCPTTISDQPFECNFSVIGAATGTNYLRIDLYKDGTSNYFGETLVNDSWYSGSDGKQYQPISTSSGTIKAKVGNPSASEFPGSGNYKIRIRRYTSSGNPSSGDQQTPKDIEITFARPTPTSTPTDTPTPTKTTTPTKTSTPTPTNKLTSTPTKVPSNNPTLTPIENSSDNTQVNLPQSILGSATSAADLSPTPETLKNSKISFSNLIFIAGGIILILLGIFALTFIAKDRFKKI